MRKINKEYPLSTLQDINQKDVDLFQNFVASQGWPIYYLRAITRSLEDRILNHYPILPKV